MQINNGLKIVNISVDINISFHFRERYLFANCLLVASFCLHWGKLKKIYILKIFRIKFNILLRLLCVCETTSSILTWKIYRSTLTFVDHSLHTGRWGKGGWLRGWLDKWLCGLVVECLRGWVIVWLSGWGVDCLSDWGVEWLSGWGVEWLSG